LLYLVQRTGMSPVAWFYAAKCRIIGKRRECVIHETAFRRRCRW
jgi:intracellular multiplication protein IcmT